jgi:hypothetical protein
VPTYLVERYWPGVTSELLLEALNRGRQVMEQMRAEGISVGGVTTILIPGEEVVFSVYQAPSATVVRHLNERAGIPVSRIVEAIRVAGDQADLLGGRSSNPRQGQDALVYAGAWLMFQVNGV